MPRTDETLIELSWGRKGLRAKSFHRGIRDARLSNQRACFLSSDGEGARRVSTGLQWRACDAGSLFRG
jgi:hypothetical protein